MRLKYSQNYSDHHLMLLQNKDRTIVTIPSRRLVRAVPASRRALVMFLDSVPGPSEQRSVLPTLRNPTCKEEKPDRTMPPCLTCLPALFRLAVHSLWTAFRLSTHFNGPFNGLTSRRCCARPGSRAPAAASSSEQDGRVKVRSGVRLSDCVEMKNTSGSIRQSQREEDQNKGTQRKH